MSVVTPSASGRKPVGGGAPAPGSDIWRAIFESAFHTDAVVIAKAMQDLLGMIEKFQAEHDERSIDRALGKAGVRLSRRDSYARWIAANVLFDLAGAAWCLETAAQSLTSELLPDPDGANV